MSEQTNVGAWCNNHALKAEVVARLAEHRAAERLVQGTGWNGEKGCNIGCLFENYDHHSVARRMNVPPPLLHLCDRIFEELPKGQAEEFATAWPAAIRVGSDQAATVDRWLLWLLRDSDLRAHANELARSSIDHVASLFERRLAGDEPSPGDWAAARAAAWAAGEAAARAAAGEAAGAAAYQDMAAALVRLIESAPASFGGGVR